MIIGDEMFCRLHVCIGDCPVALRGHCVIEGKGVCGGAEKCNLMLELMRNQYYLFYFFFLSHLFVSNYLFHSHLAFTFHYFPFC